MIKKAILYFLEFTAKPLIGKGFIDKYAPFLNKAFLFIYTQVQQETTRIVNVALGAKLKIYTKDPGIGLPLLVKHSYEPKQTQLFLDIISPGNVVLDIGANVGYYTILSSSKVGNKGRVFAFEPNPETFKLLSENVKLNQCSNVTLEKKAISNVVGRVYLDCQRFNKGDSSISHYKSDKTLTTESITLDCFVKTYPQVFVDVIKMDIEGSEIMVLNAARTAFNRWKSCKLFIEYNPSSLSRYGGSEKELISLIQNHGFKITKIIDETRGKILPYSKINLNKVMSHCTYCNLYCLK